MLESFFHLKQRPFSAAPRIDRYFPAPAIESARQSLARCVERCEGVGLLVGSAGVGKTLLCQMLAEQFRGPLEVALLANGHLTTERALLQAIHFELGLPFRGLDDGELRLSLVERLAANPAGSRGLLLLVDEAHTLPPRLLEELRLLTNIVVAREPRVRLVLAGGPPLEEKLTHPRLESFNQRISARCYLSSLDRQQTARYIQAQWIVAGGAPEGNFGVEAHEAVYCASDGVPRTINQICDHALTLAYAAGERRITARRIEEAWAELQQLPPSWSAPPTLAIHAEGSRVDHHPHGAHSDSAKFDDVVEFGGLDDEPALGRGDVQRLRSPIHLAPTPLDEDLDSLGALAADDELPTIELAEPSDGELALDPDPFAESFEDEEWVIDRYAGLETSDFSGRPLVQSVEGRSLGQMLAPYLLGALSTNNSMGGLSIAVGSASNSRNEKDSRGREAPRPEHDSSTRASVPTSRGQAPIAARAEKPIGVCEPEESELILIEEDPPLDMVLTASVARDGGETAVEMGDYRRLFARLRA